MKPRHILLILTITFLSGAAAGQHLTGYSTLDETESFTSYKIIYNTIDHKGENRVASGAVYVPKRKQYSYPLLSVGHGTVADQDNTPSAGSNSDLGQQFSNNAYISIWADYLGLGESNGVRPYLHWESAATASIDAIRAARELLSDSLGIEDNGQVFLTGYSQGGHTAMAVHKYIHENELAEEFPVVASLPMSGPYALSHIQVDQIFNENGIYFGSLFLPMIFGSYQMIYENLYSDYSHYYDKPYDSDIESWVNSGSFGSLPINLYDFMQDSVVDNITANIDHPFRKALAQNDLHNWVPMEPVRMLYCGMDNIVTHENAILAEDTMNLLGAPDVKAIEIDAEGTHGTCLDPSVTYLLDFIDSLAHVSIPDANFLNALLDSGVDSDEDGNISYAEAKAVNRLDLGNKEISDLTGIEAFENLDTLDCSENQLSMLDISYNTELMSLLCEGNLFTVLDLSNNRDLLHIDVGDMPLLGEVCVWEGFNEDMANTVGSDAICFQSDCNGDCTGVGIDDMIYGDFTIYPNPSTSSFTLYTPTLTRCELEIHSLNGQLVHWQTVSSASQQIDFSQHPGGIYFITVSSDTWVRTKKVVKL